MMVFHSVEASVSYFQLRITLVGSEPSSLVSVQVNVIGLVPSSILPDGATQKAKAVLAAVENSNTAVVDVVPPVSVPVMYQEIVVATGICPAAKVTCFVFPEMLICV